MTLDDARNRLFERGVLRGGWRRRAAIKALAGAPGTAGVLALAAALGQNHPSPKEITRALVRLSPEAEADKVEALWQALAKAPSPAFGDVLVALGWPPGRVVEPKISRDVLSAAVEGAAPAVLQAIAVFARALPVGDEAGNEALYAAWVRSQSPELERLTAEQGHQSDTPAFETLHALVTGRLDRYGSLKDQDGSLLVQSFSMAPEPFRARLAQAVAASPDRGVKDAYQPRRRRALPQGPRALPGPRTGPGRRQAPGRRGPERPLARAPDGPPGRSRAPNRAKEDHVLWVSACAGDASLLQAPIGGSPEDYARHSAALKQASGAAAGRTQALLTILCTFQGVFVAGEATFAARHGERSEGA